ncbi:MAG: hypothetical protein Q8L27_01055, partial [archaeon]|nr:hypothetical protein [archaeon]
MLKNLLKECKKYALDQALTGKTVAIGNMCARPQVRETESELAQVVEKFKGDVKEAQEEIEEYRLFVGIYGVMPLLKNRAP